MADNSNTKNAEVSKDGPKKYQSANQDLEKDTLLSNLTAKYNNPRSGLLSQTNQGEHCIGNSNLFNFKFDRHLSSDSSGDDNSSDSETGPSLAALAAKHKMARNNDPSLAEYITTGNVSKEVISRNKRKRDSDSKDCGLSALVSKYTSALTLNPSSNRTCLSESSTLKSQKEVKKEDFTSTIVCYSGEKNMSYTTLLNKPDKITRFVQARFVDSDSDSDEPKSLVGLVSKRNRNKKDDVSESADDCQQSELTISTGSYRYHTKSESDSFSNAFDSVSDNLMKRIDNETSTSLISLKSGVNTGQTFQFTLGCSVPNSFRSKTSCGFTSSLSSLKKETIPMPRAKNSYSDPDVSVNIKGFKSHVLSSIIYPSDDNSPTDEIDLGFAGINLSTAIKTPSVSKLSDGASSEIEVDTGDEGQEAQIMTLLDHLTVDEVIDAKNSEDIKPLQIEVCTLDAGGILTAKLKLRTKKCSPLGKVVCRQWHQRNIPYLKKETIESSLVPFNFSTLSPDDELASHLKK